MRSDTVIIHFPPVKFQKGLEYLKGITGPMTSVIRDFSALKDEQQMANFKNPSWVSDKMREYREDRDSMNTNEFKNFNSATTAIYLLKSCAKLNLAIYALRDKYRKEEIEMAKNKYNLANDTYSYWNYNPNWAISTDEDVLRIRNAAVKAMDMIQSYSKKHTLPNFEQDFINTIKYSVYGICHRFSVETRTLTEKATETGGTILGSIVAFVFICFSFWLFAKCATSL